MGMLDNELIFSDGQAITAIGDTASTNVVDTAAGTGGTAGTAPIANNGQGDAGMTGENLWVVMSVRAGFASGGAATLQGVLQSSTDNATWTDVASGPVVPLIGLTAGFHLLRIQPPVLSSPGMGRYWRTVARGAVAVFTAGTIDSYVANTTERNIPRASGIPAV